MDDTFYNFYPLPPLLTMSLYPLVLLSFKRIVIKGVLGTKNALRILPEEIFGRFNRLILSKKMVGVTRIELVTPTMST